MAMQRVQILLDPKQRLILAELAKARNKSISEITRQAIDAGIIQMMQNGQQQRIKAALETAQQLRNSMPMLDINVVSDVRQMREERDNELISRG